MRSWLLKSEVYKRNGKVEAFMLELLSNGKVARMRLVNDEWKVEEKELFENMEVRSVVVKNIVNAVVLQVINEFGEVYQWLIQIEPFEVYEIEVRSAKKPVVLNDEMRIEVFGEIYLYVKVFWRFIEFKGENGVLRWNEREARWYECGKQ